MAQQQRDVNSDKDSDGEGDGNAYLDIGGVRIKVSQSGRVNSMRRMSKRAAQGRQRQKLGGDDASSDVPSSLGSEEMLDYLNNIESSECSQSDDVDDYTDHRANDFEILKRFSNVDLGNEGAVEDIIGSEDTESEHWTSTDLNTSSDEEEVDEWNDSPVISSFSGPNVGKGKVLTTEDLELLEPALRYPVAVKEIKPSRGAKGKNAQTTDGRKKKKKSGVKGAKGGLLAPGEKARLRRQRIEEKRAQRALGRGFDLAWVNKQLSEFVEEAKDIHCFPPLPKHECRQIQKLASLYGCKSGAQGNGKRRSVVVTSTTRTEMPQGEKLIEIGRMLTAHSLHVGSMPDGIMNETETGRWKGISSSGSRRVRKSDKKSLKQPSSKVNRPPQPIAFVSRGFHDESGVLNQEKSLEISGNSLNSNEVKDQLAEEAEGDGSTQVVRLPPSSFERRREISEEATVLTPEMHPGRLLGLNMALSQEANVYQELEDWQKGTEGRLSSRRRANRKSSQKHNKETLLESGSNEGGSSYRCASLGQEFGGFERHTKGVGSRILEKWGFAGQGAGLGREGLGIAEPIMVTRREKGLGLGA